MRFAGARGGAIKAASVLALGGALAGAGTAGAQAGGAGAPGAAAPPPAQTAGAPARPPAIPRAGPAPPSPAPRPRPAACLLRLGARGRAVVAAQRALGIAADGAFGPGTKRAVLRFQRSRRLPATGCLDRATRARLGLTPVPAPAAVALTRAQLVALQRALGVTSDGQLGPMTRAAIRLAERRAGLPVDGEPGLRLLTALGVAPAPALAAPGSHRAQAMLAAALTKVGDPYRWGAVGPDSFDCSGLVMWAAGQAGLSVPRTSFDQYQTGTTVAAGAIRAGDLVFFDTGGRGPSHVGIAVDAAHAVSATSHGVREHEIFDSYWGAHYVGAQRVG